MEEVDHRDAVEEPIHLVLNPHEQETRFTLLKGFGDSPGDEPIAS